jgi:N6-L-threonylcarbamoyladenine synthase
MDIIERKSRHMAAGELLILGIETSCDETAAAVVRRDGRGRGELLANIVLSQVKEHAPFGGVVPEIAARSHTAHLDGLVGRVMNEARLNFADLDGIAATAGPGLLGGLLVGLTMAKGISLSRSLPFVAVNHLEAHALTPRLLGSCEFPYLLLLISGGHTQFQLVRGVGDYVRIGSTIDDALGEAFDKVAKLLGLDYPGGPQVEIRAQHGNASRFSLPRPLRGRADCNFSFSGLKTAVRETVHKLGVLNAQDVADVCASFEQAVAETMEDRLRRAFEIFRDQCPNTLNPVFVVAGGVAANRRLRAMFEKIAQENGFHLNVPPIHLCTDNAAMVAWAGAERLALGMTDDLDFKARPRWPLDTASTPIFGAGRLGAKV